MNPYSDAPALPAGEALDLCAAVFGTKAAIELEIGPGRGWFMVERLESDARVHMVGFEIRRKWATVVDRRLNSRGLGDRGRVFAVDAREGLTRLGGETLSRIFIHFPDPWWKKRHAKRLLISADFAAELARVLRPGGELFVQTDVAERAAGYAEILDREARLAPFEEQARVLENPYGARSPRERRALSDGLPVFRLRYRRRAPR